MSCKKAMTAASVHDAMHINRWRAECNNAVADLIGYKSLGIVKAAQKAYNQSKTLANKRKLKKVVKGLSKASKTHAKQAKTVKDIIESKKTK